MILDGGSKCINSAEKIFQKIEQLLDWNELAEQVTNIEQNMSNNDRNTQISYANGLQVSTLEKHHVDEHCSTYYAPQIQFSLPVKIGGESYRLVATKQLQLLGGVFCSNGKPMSLNINSFDYSYALTKDGQTVVEASGGECKTLESSADRASAQLLEAALRDLSDIPVHVLESDSKIQRYKGAIDWLTF